VSVDERLTFIRAGGATTMVEGRDARVIAEALWKLGLPARAATAAASIVAFAEREGEALRRTSDGCVHWSPD
jgi:hypothetical protein